MEMSMNLISRQERIHHRSGHIAVNYEKYILVWGGYMPLYISVLPTEFQPNDLEFRRTEYHYMDEVWAYDTETEIWHQWCTTGHTPPQLSGCVAVVIGCSLLVFGGFCHADETRSGNSDQLYRLDLNTLEWRLLSPTGQKPTPCDKLVAWTFENKMYIFGGFGPTPAFRGSFSFQVDPSTLHSDEPRGWNNQLAVYDPRTNQWEWPRVSGTPPSPRAAHACDITGELVFIFGGRFMNTRTNDLFCLNLKTLLWSANLTSGGSGSGSVPRGRSWHSLTFVSPRRAIMYGGLDNREIVLNDCWVYDCAKGEWSEFVWTNKKMARCQHAACCSPIGQLLIHSGVKQPMESEQNKVDEMVPLDFAPKTLLRLCLDVTLSAVPKDVWRNSCLPRSIATVLQLRHEANLSHNLEAYSS